MLVDPGARECGSVLAPLFSAGGGGRIPGGRGATLGNGDTRPSVFDRLLEGGPVPCIAGRLLGAGGGAAL